MNRDDRRSNRGRGREAATRPSAAAGIQGQLTLAAKHQRDGRHRDAIKVLSQAIARQPDHAGAHDAIATSYQALGRVDEAVTHFKQAIALGLLDVEALVKQSRAVMAAISRQAYAWPRPLSLAELIGTNGAGAVGGDGLLMALLGTRPVCDLELERLLTAIRAAFLREAHNSSVAESVHRWFDLACALAHQCFMNEYVFALSSVERTQSQQLVDRLVRSLEIGTGIVPVELAIAACYTPLHRLPLAERLTARPWPQSLDALLTLQLRQPLAERADQATIPVLTEIEDPVSRRVRDQYEENPYPRWTVPQPVRATSVESLLREQFGVTDVGTAGRDILVAGCGTGEHSIETARRFPQAKLLAIDINRSGLAYARRKSREMGLDNIEYAVADILNLGSLDRRFDLIEAIGVLHHLADPEAGWRVLLSLLRPGGVMRIGLYSALARRQLDAGQKLIGERGYRPTADDIRSWRQDLIRHGQPIASSDFFTTSGCRDLCFNVMEHRFTLPQIKGFLEAHKLTLLGLEAPAEVREEFAKTNPEPAARTDLDRWHALEQANPRAFQGMYFFWARCSTSVATLVWMQHAVPLFRIARHLAFTMLAA